MNNATTRVRNLLDLHPELMAAAQDKVANPLFCYAGLDDKTTALRLAVCSLIGRYSALSLSELNSVEWELLI